MSKGFTNLTQFTILPIHSACVSTRNVINVKILREKKYLSKVENIFIIVSELYSISVNYSTVFDNIRRVMAKKKPLGSLDYKAAFDRASDYEYEFNPFVFPEEIGNGMRTTRQTVMMGRILKGLGKF